MTAHNLHKVITCIVYIRPFRDGDIAMVQTDHIQPTKLGISEAIKTEK